jgi:MinD-like ATPase involved in chromosome partitioning or flagellar assembly
MVETSPLNLVTAIGDTERESFISSTLYNQGWNVTFRALDFSELEEFVKTGGGSDSTLVASTDSEGFELRRFAEIKKSFAQNFLFTPTQTAANYPSAIPMPTTPLDLIGIIRGSLRTPMFQSNQISHNRRKARVIAVGSAGRSTGCTTVVTNLGWESAQLEQKTLIVDADTECPSVALLMGERGLHTDFVVRDLDSHLSITEFTQGNIHEGISYLDQAIYDVDTIIIDLGSLTHFRETLTGRRWSSEALIWVSNHADSLYVVGTSGRIGSARFRDVLQELQANAIHPRIEYIISQVSPGKTGVREVQEFQGQLHVSLDIRQLPLDSRTVKSAHDRQIALMQVSERSPLRRSIAELASQLSA